MTLLVCLATINHEVLLPIFQHVILSNAVFMAKRASQKVGIVSRVAVFIMNIHRFIAFAFPVDSIAARLAFSELVSLVALIEEVSR